MSPTHAIAADGIFRTDRLAQRASAFAAAVKRIIDNNRELVAGIAKVIGVTIAAGAALIAVGVAAGGLSFAFGGLATIAGGIGTTVGAIGTALAAIVSPLGLVVAGVLALGVTLLTVTGAGGTALAWLGEQFGKLWSWAKKVFGGISDALAAGDIKLAAQVLWLSLKLVWQKGIGALNRTWLEAKRYFLSKSLEMWTGARAIAETAWHGLKVGWIETTSFFSRTWQRFANFLELSWKTIVNVATKAWNRIHGLFDEDFNADGNEIGETITIYAWSLPTVDGQAGQQPLEDCDPKRVAGDLIPVRFETRNIGGGETITGCWALQEFTIFGGESGCTDLT